LAIGIPASRIIRGVESYAKANADLAGTQFIPHASTWLYRNEFEDYADLAVAAAAGCSQVYVAEGDPRLQEWDAYAKRTRGRPYPRDRKGGWYFPSERPPDADSAPAE